MNNTAARWYTMKQALNIHVQPKRAPKSNKPVLIIMQKLRDVALGGKEGSRLQAHLNWVITTAKDVQAQTARPIRVRPNPNGPEETDVYAHLNMELAKLGVEFEYDIQKDGPDNQLFLKTPIAVLSCFGL